MAVSCMHSVSGHNYSNSAFIVDFAMGHFQLTLISILCICHVFCIYHKLGSLTVYFVSC